MNIEKEQFPKLKYFKYSFLQFLGKQILAGCWYCIISQAGKTLSVGVGLEGELGVIWRRLQSFLFQWKCYKINLDDSFIILWVD